MYFFCQNLCTIFCLVLIKFVYFKISFDFLQFIEHLEKLKRLHTLNLSFNIVEKIEKLDKLVRLRDLNLSYNKLSRIENLETLTQLQHLNLSGNLIEHVPAWLGKKLKALRVLKLAKNQLQSVSKFCQTIDSNKDLTMLIHRVLNNN